MKNLVKGFRNTCNKIDKYFEKKVRNIRYETRYKNALKKIEELEQEIREVKKKLDKDKNLKEIENLRGQIIRLKNVNSNLSRDVRTLEERLRGVNE